MRQSYRRKTWRSQQSSRWTGLSNGLSPKSICTLTPPQISKNGSTSAGTYKLSLTSFTLRPSFSISRRPCQRPFFFLAFWMSIKMASSLKRRSGSCSVRILHSGTWPTRQTKRYRRSELNAVHWSTVLKSLIANGCTRSACKGSVIATTRDPCSTDRRCSANRVSQELNLSASSESPRQPKVAVKSSLNPRRKEKSLKRITQRQNVWETCSKTNSQGARKSSTMKNQSNSTSSWYAKGRSSSTANSQRLSFCDALPPDKKRLTTNDPFIFKIS
jgi:hypothetical protein